MPTNSDYSTWLTKQAAANAMGVSLRTIQNLDNQHKIVSELWRNPSGTLMRVYEPESVQRLAAARQDGGSPRFTTGNGSAPASVGLVIPAAGQSAMPPGNYLEVMASTQKAIAGQHTAAMIAAQRLASKLCLTIPEAAEFAGVSKKLIHDACEAGTLDAFRDGRVWRIPRARLVARYGPQEP